jgi:hypothetical protein
MAIHSAQVDTGRPQYGPRREIQTTDSREVKAIDRSERNLEAKAGGEHRHHHCRCGLPPGVQPRKELWRRRDREARRPIPGWRPAPGPRPVARPWRTPSRSRPPTWTPMSLPRASFSPDRPPTRMETRLLARSLVSPRLVLAW